MSSLLELVEKVNRGESVDPQLLEVYQDSTNQAEKFLASHARAMLDLRRSQNHLLTALQSIDFSDQKVLGQYLNVLNFLGQEAQGADPIVRFASAALKRREAAVALESLQIGAATGFVTDRDSGTTLAQQYERASFAAGWYPTGTAEHNDPEIRIGYLTTSLADDESASATIVGLSRRLETQNFKLSVYVTDALAKRPRQTSFALSTASSSAKRGKETLENLSKTNTPVTLASTATDLLASTRELAEKIQKDQIDVLLIDANLADPVAAILSNWPVAKRKVAVARSSTPYGKFDCVVYLDAEQFKLDKDFWTRQQTDVRLIPDGIDLCEYTTAPVARSSYGIPDQCAILATAGTNLPETLNDEFVDSVISILRANSTAVYLVVGDGDFSNQKRRFEAAGVSKRVGYTGRRNDVADFLRMTDIYLAEFPATTSAGLLAAMSVGKPVVAMYNQQTLGTLLGAEQTVPPRDNTAYVERASQFVRNPEFRNELGKALRERVETNFSFAQTCQAIQKLASSLAPKAAASVAQAA